MKIKEEILIGGIKYKTKDVVISYASYIATMIIIIGLCARSFWTGHYILGTLLVFPLIFFGLVPFMRRRMQSIIERRIYK